MRLTTVERWISLVRAIAFPLVLAAVASGDIPTAYRTWAWITTCVFGVGAGALFALARSERAALHPFAQSVLAQCFDTAIVIAYVLVLSYERGLPVQQILYLDLAAACVRFGMTGGVLLAAVSAPVLGGFERLRSNHLNVRFSWELVIMQTALELSMAAIVGWLVQRLVLETRSAGDRAEEAEGLRDELGRRVDLLDAANRCARALSSSLELRESFGNFIRELAGLVPFDRVAIVLADDGMAQVMATAGVGAETLFPSGSRQPLEGTLLDELQTQPLYRPKLEADRYVEEREFVAVGLGSRIVAPLLSGARVAGMLALVRREEDAFSPAEIEVVGLLGRLVASTVQNIRAYEAERRTVDELRRLSTMRADFVSLVSHELRTPMASVIGSARTLQARWRELTSEQRDAFLALIADETDRLAGLIGEVLDTSRIDAGTFTYSFAAVDLAGLVEETVSTASLGQDAVEVAARIPRALPVVRGDGARLRQVLANLVDNAVKYSPEGELVEVRATAVNGKVVVDVSDRGPGIAPADQRLIFEKFGRVTGTSTKPGTGLGLYIARAIVEAHGGQLEVSSAPGLGATFTLTLPVS
ncbi:MAG TPA: ATP-binding protein [Gaiellaceae bacterium]|jgi:signal transduction histidine kinase